MSQLLALLGFDVCIGGDAAVLCSMDMSVSRNRWPFSRRRRVNAYPIINLESQMEH